MFLLLLIFSILGIINANVKETPHCSIPGVCRDNPVIHSSRQINRNDCLKDCQEVEGCTWFTYDSTMELCLSFKDCSYVSPIKCQDCVSGQAHCRTSAPVPDPQTSSKSKILSLLK